MHQASKLKDLTFVSYAWQRMENMRRAAHLQELCLGLCTAVLPQGRNSSQGCSTDATSMLLCWRAVRPAGLADQAQSLACSCSLGRSLGQDGQALGGQLAAGCQILHEVSMCELLAASMALKRVQDMA